MILLIDGNSWASSWVWALGCGSVIVSISCWDSHLTAELVPFEHFVPCKIDLSDLEEVVLWVFAHPAESKRITQNAKKLFRRVSTLEHTRRAVAAALL